MQGAESPRAGTTPALFSPFGLGILDLAVARLAYDLAREHGAGTAVHDFLPDPWTERVY